MRDTRAARASILAKIRSAYHPETAEQEPGGPCLAPEAWVLQPDDTSAPQGTVNSTNSTLENTLRKNGAAYAAIERSYLRTDALSAAERIHFFEERLQEYDAGVYRAAADSLPEMIARVIGQRQKQRVAYPAGIPEAWLQPPQLFVTDADTLSARDLDLLDGVLTACTTAIALTGTIVLQNAPAQGPRRLSLIPDYHLCIVFADQIVGTVAEAFERLALTATLPTTFISGPSATADIEMTRIKGVHGPRFLDVIIVT